MVCLCSWWCHYTYWLSSERRPFKDHFVYLFLYIIITWTDENKGRFRFVRKSQSTSYIMTIILVWYRQDGVWRMLNVQILFLSWRSSRVSIPHTQYWVLWWLLVFTYFWELLSTGPKSIEWHRCNKQCRLTMPTVTGSQATS